MTITTTTSKKCWPFQANLSKPASLHLSTCHLIGALLVVTVFQSPGLDDKLMHKVSSERPPASASAWCGNHFGPLICGEFLFLPGEMVPLSKASTFFWEVIKDKGNIGNLFNKSMTIDSRGWNVPSALLKCGAFVAEIFSNLLYSWLIFVWSWHGDYLFVRIVKKWKRMGVKKKIFP